LFAHSNGLRIAEFTCFVESPLLVRAALSQIDRILVAELFIHSLARVTFKITLKQQGSNA
jgi:hypothetical protein